MQSRHGILFMFIYVDDIIVIGSIIDYQLLFQLGSEFLRNSYG